MAAIPRELLAWTANHHTTITSAGIRASGVSAAQQKRLVTAGVLERISNGVYRFAGAPIDMLAKCVAASAHPSGLVIASVTAGRLWTVRRMPNDQYVCVIAPPASHPIGAPWLRAYRTSLLDPNDIVRRADGIVLTSPSRTAVDLTRALANDDLRSVIDQIEQRRMGTAESMRRIAESLNTPGRPWARRFLEVLEQRPGGGARESHGESRVVSALFQRGVSDLTSQRWLTVPGWGNIRLDAAVDRIKWGIEIDGHPEHFTEAGATRDRERDLACEADGWRISRVTGLSLDRHFGTTIDRLMAVYWRRCAEVEGVAG
jgi:very-short-patch-repair endonuclease